jgi:hypothetical protein
MNKPPGSNPVKGRAIRVPTAAYPPAVLFYFMSSGHGLGLGGAWLLINFLAELIKFFVVVSRSAGEYNPEAEFF